MTDTTDFETKAGGSVGAAFEEFMRAFEVYKDTNDDRLAEIERRSASDPLIDDKLARLDRTLDETKRLADRLAVKAQRPHLGGPDGIETAAVREHRRAFDEYVRKGETANLSRLEAKALAVTTNSGTDGGYLVPPETERTVMSALKDISPIRAIASVRQVSGSVYKKPFATTGFAYGWVAETATRSQTNTPTLAELSFPTMELYAMPAATATLLDDSAVNIDEWIAEEVRDTFAQQEGTAFVSGNGTDKPKGFLDYTKVADGSWSWGNIGFIKTGVDGAFPASDPADKLIDLVYTAKAGYRANATFVFNRGTQAAIRKMKDGDGQYVWQVGEVTYELSGLLRGQAGSEEERRAALPAGATFVLLGPEIARVVLAAGEVGLPLNWRIGPASRDIADRTYADAAHAFRGTGLKPLSPAHVRAARNAGGDVTFAWKRRTRIGGDSWEAADVPLAEETERYEIDVLDGATVKRTLSATIPTCTYAAAEQTTDFGAPQSALSVAVYQMSAVYGRGTPKRAVV